MSSFAFDLVQLFQASWNIIQELFVNFDFLNALAPVRQDLNVQILLVQFLEMFAHLITLLLS